MLLVGAPPPRRWAPGAARAGPGTGAHAGGGGAARAQRLPARATQQQQQQQHQPQDTLNAPRPREHLRVLRYPNGDERVIRYPAYAQDADGTATSASARAASVAAAAAPPPTATPAKQPAPPSSRAAPAAGSGDSGTAGGGGGGGGSSGLASSSLDDYLSWDVTGLWSSSTARPEAPSSPDAPPQPSPSMPPAAADAPSNDATSEAAAPPTEHLSDADYLESLFAAAYATEKQQPKPLAPRGTSSRPATAATTPAAPSKPPTNDDPSPPLPAGTYQVLTGCPWPVPRPLYTLALRGSASAAAAALASRLRRQQDEAAAANNAADDDADAGGDQDRVGSTYTLSVRTRDRGAADDLARALGKAADWAAHMDVGARRDGVVAFASERDARRYAALLERPASAEEPGGGHSGVAVARVDSHALFRAAADVQSVVVYLPPCGGGGAGFEAAAGGDSDSGSGSDGSGSSSGGESSGESGGTVPRPHQLAAALLRG